MYPKYYGIFVVLRALEHRETIYFWKVEDHNFHHVLTRKKSIKISRHTVSLGPKKSKIFGSENIFSDPKNFRLLRTQTDRAPRDFYEIASDQNVVKIMVFYFPKIYGFPMLRSMRGNEKLLLSL